ncbi:hypothetical protein [Spiroplasma alleghenense]|uniref:4-diphosphocytidyl-2-C-methyl-D-erythritol kinase n=1 Tax=Spiroplasma alleghenense TaxID=216931 RepID=A0A345Z5B6_9MOLU|nr:hypothetical protein [Spiroplasma alleghenense]AXK51795.1 4-diphosphocytidyl-2-C-methyl-D-erythritol kinase [Spiroplasma alleghenense]
MTINSFCKVNLSLRVRKNWRIARLHRIKSKITLVEDFYDTIKITEIPEKKIKLICNFPEILNENNSVVRAAMEFLKFHEISTGLEIKLIKRIPLGSGLGGGSSNAIATIECLTQMFQLNRSKPLLKIVCKAIGYDSYFFASGYKTAIVSGYGQRVKKAKVMEKIGRNDLILNRHISCSTRSVYERYDEIYDPSMLEEVNSLKQACISAYPEMQEVFKMYPEAQLSGTGSTMFIIPPPPPEVIPPTQEELDAAAQEEAEKKAASYF